MAISLKRYVDITSGVGAGANVAQRALIGRFFVDNPLIPSGSTVSFSDADSVSAYFGSASNEYKRAAFWFGWISKSITDTQAISFARWNSAAVAPRIYGAKGSQAVASYSGITTGAFTLTLGATTHTLTGLNFSSAVSLSDIASVVQAAIRTQTGAMWTAATVVWDSTRASFDFVGGATGDAVIAVVAGTGGNDVAGLLGWLSATAILSKGADVQTITAVLSQSAGADNNFGSFAFEDTLTQDQIVEAATWNDAQNNMFLYSVPCSSSNATALSTALALIGGVTLTLSPIATEYPEQIPMMILAATDYTARNAVQNYMFQIFSLTPSVSTNADADTYDGLRVNYYGQTQTAGQLLQFYQRGNMMGIATDPIDQNTYANEIWLKDASSASIMTLLLALTEIPANSRGRAQILTVLQGVVTQALFNGSISVGKTLTSAQKLYIAQLTGDALAWKQIENIGYWLDVRIVSEVVNSITQYKAVYTLVYSKDDVIRKVQGSDILI